MPKDGKKIDRRSVLRTIGTAAALGTGISATAGATAAQTGAKERLQRGYDSEYRLSMAFEQHGDGLRKKLVESGLVAEDFEFSDLDFRLDSETDGIEPTSTDGHASVAGVSLDGKPTAFGSVSMSTDTHDISLRVQPENDNAYAFAEPKDGGEQLMVTESDVSPQVCEYTSCGNYCSKTYKELFYHRCLDSACADCEVYDWSCDCYVSPYNG